MPRAVRLANGWSLPTPERPYRRWTTGGRALRLPGVSRGCVGACWLLPFWMAAKCECPDGLGVGHAPSRARAPHLGPVGTVSQLVRLHPGYCPSSWRFGRMTGTSAKGRGPKVSGSLTFDARWRPRRGDRGPRAPSTSLPVAGTRRLHRTRRVAWARPTRSSASNPYATWTPVKPSSRSVAPDNSLTPGLRVGILPLSAPPLFLLLSLRWRSGSELPLR